MQNAVAEVRPSVVRIGAGTLLSNGIIVQKGFVATSFVGLDVGEIVDVMTQEGAQRGVVRQTYLNDVLIEVPTGELPRIKWGHEGGLRAGDELYSIGFAEDRPGEPTLSSARFSAVRTSSVVRILETDVPLNNGFGGAPAFDVCGNVVGVTTSVDTAPGRLFPTETARRLTDELLRLYTLSQIPTAVPPTPDPNAPPACGDGASVTFIPPLPLGVINEPGGTVQVRFSYVGPGCKATAVNVNGYYVAGAPMQRYWCVAPAPEIPTIARCVEGRLIGIFGISEQVPVSGSGEVTVEIGGEALRPIATGEGVEAMDGFVVCHIDVELNESRFPGHVFHQTVGTPCR